MMIDHNARYLEQLPEGYEYIDLTESFSMQLHEWKKSTKKQRYKMKGLYGISYLGDEGLATTGLLRLVASALHKKLKGFIVITEDQLQKQITYVVV